MTLNNAYSSSPPYQLDREDILPTDYRSLWYANESPAYLDYDAMTHIMGNNTLGSEFTRQYVGAAGDGTAVPGKNALEAALDMTAIPTGVVGTPYQWSEAIISILTAHIVQFVSECGELEDTVAMSNGGNLPHWIMVSIASRGCTQLISRLMERLGMPDGGLDAEALSVGRWVIDALGYMPELYIMGPKPPLSRLPTLTAKTVRLLWDSYVGDVPHTVVRLAIHASGVVGTVDSNSIEPVLPNACRDVDLLRATIQVVDALDLMNDVSFEYVISVMFTSPLREVDDYSAIHTMLEWSSTYLTGTFDRDIIYRSNDLAPEIPSYYANRIKTVEQSQRFYRDSWLVDEGRDAIRACHSIFIGNIKPVKDSIATADRSEEYDDIVRAIHYVRIYIAGRMAEDAGGPMSIEGTYRALDLLWGPDVRTLMQLTTQHEVRYESSPSAHPVGILTTAARNMEVLRAAYPLFTFGQRDDVISKIRVTNPDDYGDILVDLSYVTYSLMEIARDPDSAPEALPWLIARISPTIPYTKDEWNRKVAPHAKNDPAFPYYMSFPRQKMWDDFISITIQIPSITHSLSHYSRLQTLIDFAIIPKEAGNTSLRCIASPECTPLPSMDLRRDGDGGLPVSIVRGVAEAMERSIIRPNSIRTAYEPAYVWDPIASQMLRWAVSALRGE